jgi:hypothetical protein
MPNYLSTAGIPLPSNQTPKALWLTACLCLRYAG